MEKSGAKPVTGLAIDLDAHRLYFHRNGEWLLGDPTDPDKGILLQPHRDYVAVATAGKNSGQWTANFGSSPFAYPIPSGYASYHNATASQTIP